MSPRPKNNRNVFDPPRFRGFKPFGYYASQGEPVLLLFEEYASIKLCDYELMVQSEAAKAMKISRPTFTRIYESARRKIALALSESRTIEVEKGNAYFDHEWYHCSGCGIFFNNPGEQFNFDHCPLCKSPGVEKTIPE